MRISQCSLYIAIITLLTSSITVQAQIATEPESLEPVMCTMDVKECPDGSFVGRTGPTCEFICPVGGGTSTDSADAPPAEVGAGDEDRVRDSELTESVEARQAEIRANQEARQELRNERRAALSEIRQQRIINLAANISNRMDIVVERLFTIIDRLESRIVKLEQQNVDTTEAKVALRDAAQSLAEAKSLLSDIDTAVNQATTSDDPLSAWQDLKARYQSIATLIRSTHASLRVTVAALKVSVSTPLEAGVSEAVRQDESTSNADLLPTL